VRIKWNGFAEGNIYRDYVPSAIQTAGTGALDSVAAVNWTYAPGNSTRLPYSIAILRIKLARLLLKWLTCIWDLLDNWGKPSADRIHPECQEMSVGDHLRAMPGSGALSMIQMLSDNES
jgi:hypothetical protein